MAKFVDFNSNFINTKDTDRKAIDNSIKNIILIKKFEVGAMPKFGSTLTSMLFEEPGVIEVSLIKFEIKALLDFYEPRITVNTINIAYENNKVLCDIVYSINESFEDGESSVRLRLR